MKKELKTEQAEYDAAIAVIARIAVKRILEHRSAWQQENKQAEKALNSAMNKQVMALDATR